MKEVNSVLIRQPANWKPGGLGALISPGLMGKKYKNCYFRNQQGEPGDT